MKLLKFLDKHLEECVLVLLMSSLIVVMLVQIVRRYLFNDSLLWSEEFCRYCYIWIMFTAFSYSAHLGVDLRVEALVNLLPRGARQVVELMNHVFCLLVTAFLFVCSFATVEAVTQTGERGIAVQIPLRYVYAASVAGYGLGAVRYLQRLVRFVMSLCRQPGEKGDDV